MIDQLLLWVFLALAVAATAIACLGWGLIDAYKARKCRRGRHDWPETPVSGADGIGLVFRCKNCPADFIIHRGL